MTRSHASTRSPLSPDPIPGGTDIDPPTRRPRPAGPCPKTSPKLQQRGSRTLRPAHDNPEHHPGDTTTEQPTQSGRSQRTHAVIRWIQAKTGPATACRSHASTSRPHDGTPTGMAASFSAPEPPCQSLSTPAVKCPPNRGKTNRAGSKRLSARRSERPAGAGPGQFLGTDR
jgi:hypothetical protein